jgi:uncharacterized membrane protein (UPF0127 family)
MATFLSPLLAADPSGFVLRNRRTGAVIADVLLPAFDSERRRTGLLNHTALPPGEAMIIAPTNAIHTFFMKFPIDLAFFAKDGRVLKIRRAVPPWRISAAWFAFGVVEMGAGGLHRDMVEGDHLVVAPSDVHSQER